MVFEQVKVATMSSVDAEYFGRYLGELILKPMPDGRLMRVVGPFGFLDRNEKGWPVPVNAEVDGASIPQPLWSLIGGPFEGKYRDASVVHDYYCDTRTESWRAVHRVFYDAMRASGVSTTRAKVMYAAVYFAGPRWSDTTRHNATLRHFDDPTVLYRKQHSTFELGILDAVEAGSESAHAFLRSGKVMWPSEAETHLNLAEVQKIIQSENPSLDEIEKAIDEASSVLEPPWEDNDRARSLTELPSSLNP